MSLAAGQCALSGKNRGVCVFLVCVVRMWLAPLTRHDLLTIPWWLDSDTQHISQLRVGLLWFTVKGAWKLFTFFCSHYNQDLISLHVIHTDLSFSLRVLPKQNQTWFCQHPSFSANGFIRIQ